MSNTNDHMYKNWLWELLAAWLADQVWEHISAEPRTTIYARTNLAYPYIQGQMANLSHIPGLTAIDSGWLAGTTATARNAFLMRLEARQLGRIKCPTLQMWAKYLQRGKGPDPSGELEIHRTNCPHNCNELVPLLRSQLAAEEKKQASLLG